MSYRVRDRLKFNGRYWHDGETVEMEGTVAGPLLAAGLIEEEPTEAEAQIAEPEPEDTDSEPEVDLPANEPEPEPDVQPAPKSAPTPKHAGGRPRKVAQ
jgi:hypothetical protein